MAMVATLMASCMGSDYAAPGLDPDNAPWGNNEITETNVVSIADLKARYASTIASNGYVKIEEDMQIKGVVTGNDYAGNIYQQIPVQDETGALVVGVSLRRAMPDRQRIYQPQHGQDGHRQNGQVYLAEALSLDRRG